MMAGTELLDKVALVTGAASGIGRQIALIYASQGARVLVTDVNGDGGTATVSQIVESGGTAEFCPLDTTDEEQHRTAIDRALGAFGALHIACNSAGISVGASKTYPELAEVSTADWKQIIEVNLFGLFFGMRAQLPAIIESGGGVVTNIASITGLVGRSGLSPYVTSKHGVVGLTKAAALEYATRGVRVNAIAPGFIDTPILALRDEAARAEIIADHPMGRLGLAEEVAELALWLSSERSSFVTGACYPVDGGYTAR